MVLINKLNSGERELMWNVLFHKNLRAEAWEVELSQGHS